MLLCLASSSYEQCENLLAMGVIRILRQVLATMRDEDAANPEDAGSRELENHLDQLDRAAGLVPTLQDGRTSMLCIIRPEAHDQRQRRRVLRAFDLGGAWKCP